MCGIAGCYQQTDGYELVRRFIGSLSHRGPDAEGIYSDVRDGFAAHLAHRRLSIIDLSSAANQPLSKNGLTLSYNGELYNYRALRSELVARGARFNTNSDSEVVLEAWRHWGPASLRRFRGMFAFALITEEGRLVLARDQLGIKPLYVLPRQGGIVFASELKAFLSALGHELTIDTAAMVASILYYWVPDQRCAIKGVWKLPPGSWMELDPDGTRRLQYYWRLTDVAADAAEGPPMDLGAVIEDSVAAHLVADVPLSSFLSGGLDSSIVTVLGRRHNPELDAYTISFRSEDQRPEAMPDDAMYARRLAAAHGIPLREIEISPAVTELLPRMVDVLDEPIGDPAAINTLLMCEAARDSGVKAVLSGMGADELFGGYRKHVACSLAASYRRLPGGLRNKVVEPVVDALPVAVGGRGLRYARWAKRFVTFADLGEEAAFRRSYTLFDPDALVDLVGAEAGRSVAGILEEHRLVYEDTRLEDHVNRMCLADARLFLPGLNLAYTDRASMAASVEVRVPFVDPEVVRAAFSLQGSEKVRRGHGKVALKRAARAWLPSEIVNRPKASFGAPLRAWVRHDLREMVDDLLLKGSLVEGGFLRRSAVADLVAEDRAGRQDRAKQIWHLLTLELWYRHARSLGVGGDGVLAASQTTEGIGSR